MLTKDQKQWINHLSNTKVVKIIPFDPTCINKFEKIKSVIEAKLKDVEIKHCGASSLGISGQDEVDIFIPVSKKAFDFHLLLLTELFGNPKSLYPLKRARFATEVDKKHIDVFLINESSPDWQRSLVFENYLKSNPRALKEYKELKEAGNGISVRKYYARKIEFINSVLINLST